MNKTLRRLFTCAAAGALAVSLAACGPDDGSATTSQFMAGDTAVDPGWSMMDLAGVDPAFLGNDGADLGALPQALPMAASYSGGDYGYAPSYDYAPDERDSYYAPLDESYYYDDGYYDDGYYEDGYYDGGYYDAASYDDGYDEGYYNLGNDGSDYGLLALAVSLAAMLGDSPPDYGYYYDDVSPWAWQTGDGYYRYAEPIDDGYRYYYYEPNSYRPFLVSDPYYSYGYRDDRLVAIYDRGGRRIDARRAELQLRAAKAYYARADRLYEAAQRDRYGVPAPLWSRQRDTIAHDRDRWFRDQAERPAWKRWETRNQPKLYRQWSGEALVRRDAERRFDGWQKADYKTPAPKFYTPDVRREQVREIADLRRDRANDIAERRRDFAEQRAAQQRETKALAERAQEARRERVSQLAERREQPAQPRPRGIAISDIRERAADRPSVADRIAERREQRQAVGRPDNQPRAAAPQRPDRPSVAQRVERERPAPAARQEARRAEAPKPRAAVERPAPQPRAQQPRAQQVKREQPKAAVKRAQPAERVRAERPQPLARREAPAPRAEQPKPRQAAAPAPLQQPQRASRPERPQAAQRAAAPQPHAERPEPRQQVRQQVREQRTEARQQAAPQPRVERPQPRQQARQEAAPQAARPERQQARPEPAQRQQQAEARQQARQERQEARTAQREERRQRPS